MHDAVLAALPADVYIGAAAVADFTPRAIAASKLKKQPGQDTLALELVRTRDILAEVAAHAAAAAAGGRLRRGNRRRRRATRATSWSASAWT